MFPQINSYICNNNNGIANTLGKYSPNSVYALADLLSYDAQLKTMPGLEGGRVEDLASLQDGAVLHHTLSYW